MTPPERLASKLRFRTTADEIAYLRERLEFLEGELSIRSDEAEEMALRRAWRLSGSEAKIALQLARQSPAPVQSWAIEERLQRAYRGENSTVLKVHICRVRRVMAKLLNRNCILFYQPSGYVMDEIGASAVLSAAGIG